MHLLYPVAGLNINEIQTSQTDNTLNAIPQTLVLRENKTNRAGFDVPLLLGDHVNLN